MHAREKCLADNRSHNTTPTGKLLGQEDAVRDDMMKSFDVVVKGTQTAHSEQNRARISEIQHLLQQSTQEIADILQDEQQDEDYGD